MFRFATKRRPSKVSPGWTASISGSWRAINSGVTARRDDSHFCPRERFGADTRDDLAHQSAVSVDRARHHRAARGFADRAGRFAQGQLRQQRSPLIKKAGHRFQTGRDHATDIIPAADTTSKVTAVPKSTTMAGRPYNCATAAAFASRSAPIVRGAG